MVAGRPSHVGTAPTAPEGASRPSAVRLTLNVAAPARDPVHRFIAPPRTDCRAWPGCPISVPMWLLLTHGAIEYTQMGERSCEGAAPREVRVLDGVVGEGQRAVVGRGGVRAPAGPHEELGTGGPVGLVVRQVEGLHGREPDLRAVEFGER